MRIQQSLVYSIETGQSPPHIKTEQGTPPYVMGFKNSADILRIDLDPTTKGPTNRQGYKTITHVQLAFFCPMLDTQL